MCTKVHCFNMKGQGTHLVSFSPHGCLAAGLVLSSIQKKENHPLKAAKPKKDQDEGYLKLMSTIMLEN